MPESAEIQEALLKIPNPVAVLSVTDGEEVNGMIASWVTQISANPPQVLVAVKPTRYSHDMIASAGYFVLNLLREDQKGSVPQFKLKGDARDEKYKGIATAKDSHGQVYLTDAAATLHCRVVKQVSAGDHTLFIGEVTEGHANGAVALSTISYGKGYSGKG